MEQWCPCFMRVKLLAWKYQRVILFIPHLKTVLIRLYIRKNYMSSDIGGPHSFDACKEHYNGRAEQRRQHQLAWAISHIKEDGTYDGSVSMKNNTHPVKIIASVRSKPMKLKEEASSHPFKTSSSKYHR